MCKVDVSIIIPVYNAGQYLRDCIDSVLVQDFKNWEMILVNDGSTDCSIEICDEYVKKDVRISVVHKINTGVSDSRNIGIARSKGRYLMFLDADDYWISSKTLSHMMSVADKYELDVLRGEYNAIDEYGAVLYLSKMAERRRAVSYVTLNSYEFLEKVLLGESFVFLSLFRKDALNGVEFNVGRSFLEDTEFYSKLMLKKLKCMYVPYDFYAYRKSSVSVSSQTNIKKLEDSFNMCYVFDSLADAADLIEQKKYYRRLSIMMYYWTLDTLSIDPYYACRNSIIKQLSLDVLLHNIRVWKCKATGTYPLIIYVSPNLGVNLFRLRHSLGNVIKRLIS